jgi:hypothetical protein
VVSARPQIQGVNGMVGAKVSLALSQATDLDRARSAFPETWSVRLERERDFVPSRG